MNKKYRKSQKGITIIVLVITIIVMIILAGTTINMVLGEGGFLNQSQRTKELQEKKIEKEDTEVNNLIDKADEEIAKVHLTKGRKVFGTNVEWKEKDEEGKEYIAIIPVGFCVVKDVVVNETTGEKDVNNIPNGLVISDKENDDLNNSAGGNQFVWIPVEDMSKFVRIEGFQSNARDTMITECKEAGKEGATISTDESRAMYQSVEDNGGFYIARFEAGVSGVTTPITEASAVPTPDGTTLPVSKKGVAAWNYIPWGGTTAKEATDGLQGNDKANGAVRVSRSMYTKSNVCGVTSTLCYGVQWDAIMQYIDPNYYWEIGETDNVAEDSFVRNSSEKGNYSTNFLLTGANSKYQQKHIYDLGGNVWEYTMEAYKDILRVSRGSCLGSSPENDPASVRTWKTFPNNEAYEYIRFPCILILVIKKI